MKHPLLIWSLTTVALLIVGLPRTDYPWWEGGRFPDAVADKYVAKAAADGFGAHRPFIELAEHYEVPGDPWEHVHPRPPAALIGQLPLVLIPDQRLLAFMALVTAVSTAATFAAVAQISGGNLAWSVVAVFFGYSWHEWTRGNFWWLLAGALVAWGWVGVRSGKRWGPWLIGLVAAVKVWPLFVIAGLWLIRRRHAIEALVVAAGATTLGLLLPGVSIGTFGGEGALEFVETTANLSLAKWFVEIDVPAPIVAGAVVAAGLWWVAVRHRRSVDWILGVSVVGGLLAAPLSWMVYWTAALPAVGVWIHRIDVKRAAAASRRQQARRVAGEELDRAEVTGDRPEDRSFRDGGSSEKEIGNREATSDASP